MSGPSSTAEEQEQNDQEKADSDRARAVSACKFIAELFIPPTLNCYRDNASHVRA